MFRGFAHRRGARELVHDTLLGSVAIKADGLGYLAIVYECTCSMIPMCSRICKQSQNIPIRQPWLAINIQWMI